MREEAPRTVTAICRALQEQIDHGLLPEGGRLPAERALSELFETTRITLREALGQLEAEGLIYREERRGWFVSPRRLAYNPLVRSHFHAMVAALRDDAAHVVVLVGGHREQPVRIEAARDADAHLAVRVVDQRFELARRHAQRGAGAHGLVQIVEQRAQPEQARVLGRDRAHLEVQIGRAHV